MRRTPRRPVESLAGLGGPHLPRQNPVLHFLKAHPYLGGYHCGTGIVVFSATGVVLIALGVTMVAVLERRLARWRTGQHPLRKHR